MATELEKKISKLGNLKQNKGKDRSVLERQAQLSIWKEQIDLESRFTLPDDKEIASKIFDNYIENYTIDAYVDIQNLVDLVYEEVMQKRIQKDIDKILSDDSNNMVPDKKIDSLHSIQERIWILKEKIGIIQTDKKDDLTALQELEKKFDLYINFNRNEFTVYAPYKCSSCGREDVEPLLLRRRVKDFDVLIHPAFSGRFWYNRRGIQLVKKGIWSKEQYAFVFFTSVSYVEWILKNEHKIIELGKIKQEDVEEFIRTNPFLRDVTIPANIVKENIEEK